MPAILILKSGVCTSLCLLGLLQPVLPPQSHSPERGGRVLQLLGIQVWRPLTPTPSAPGSWEKHPWSSLSSCSSPHLHSLLLPPPGAPLHQPPGETFRDGGECSGTGPVPSSGTLSAARPHSQDFPTLSSSLNDVALGKLTPHLNSKGSVSCAQVLSNQMSAMAPPELAQWREGASLLSPPPMFPGL